MSKVGEQDWRWFERNIAASIREWGAVVPRTGIWIRDHLRDVGEDYVWNMYRAYREFARDVPFNPGKYQTYRTYLYVCKLIGLIAEKRRERSLEVNLEQSPKVFYCVVEEKLGDTAWENPYKAYSLQLEAIREFSS